MTFLGIRFGIPLRELAPVPRRATGMWRAFFGIYAGVVTVGTHWPRLQLGDAEHPPDKMLHFIAFGGLAFLLWQARLVRSLGGLFVVALVWASIDEVTQAFPGLGRSFSYEDVLAGALGIASTVSLLWATRPLALPVARLRRQRFDALVDLVLSSPTRWMACLMTCALGVLIAMPASILINHLSGSESHFQAAVIGALFGALSGGFAFVLRGVNRFDEKIMTSRLCLGCEANLSEATDPCPTCGTQPMLGQWYPVPGLTWGGIGRGTYPSVLGGAGTLLLSFILLQVYAAYAPPRGVILAVNAWWRELPPGMHENFNAAFLVFVAAVTVDRCRARIARQLEAGHRACLGCGHDLRATPAPEGLGRCSECGAGFVRPTLRNP